MHTLIHETFGLVEFSGIVEGVFVRACAHDNVVVLLLVSHVRARASTFTTGTAPMRTAIVEALESNGGVTYENLRELVRTISTTAGHPRARGR